MDVYLHTNKIHGIDFKKIGVLHLVQFPVADLASLQERPVGVGRNP